MVILGSGVYLLVTLVIAGSGGLALLGDQMLYWSKKERRKCNETK